MIAFGLSFIMVLMLAQPASAQTETGSVTDPVGDANMWILKNQPIPGYLDIVGAEVTLEGGIFTMILDMAATIPDEPEFVKGANIYWWEWAFDTGPGFYPIFPFGSTWEERTVIIQWDGEEWSADLYDWTSVQNWKDPVLSYSLDLTRDPQQFEVTVQSEQMGDPETFLWGAGTLGWLSPSIRASYAWWPFDMAVDETTGEWASWPE